jgi:hypothetical protein
VVVDDFDIFRASFSPSKADPPLVVDPDAVLPDPVAAKRFQAIAAEPGQLSQCSRFVQLAQSA